MISAYFSLNTDRWRQNFAGPRLSSGQEYLLLNRFRSVYILSHRRPLMPLRSNNHHSHIYTCTVELLGSIIYIKTTFLTLSWTLIAGSLSPSAISDFVMEPGFRPWCRDDMLPSVHFAVYFGYRVLVVKKLSAVRAAEPRVNCPRRDAWCGVRTFGVSAWGTSLSLFDLWVSSVLLSDERPEWYWTWWQGLLVETSTSRAPICWAIHQ